MTTKTIDKRIVALFGLVMAALVVLSALAASDAQAKKKRHHHRAPVPSINTVQCPNQTLDDFDCFGTDVRDHLVGRDNEFDFIFGGDGDDIYDGKGGSDDWVDQSTASSDVYLVPATEFSQLFAGTKDARLGITDIGGSFDVLALSAYKSTDFALSKVGDLDSNGADELRMHGEGARDIVVFDFLSDRNSIDFFKFSDGTFAADQIKSLVP